MNKKIILLLSLIFLVLAYRSNAQIIYWTESFENTVIPGNSSSYISTPTNVDLTATSGIWNMYFVYRGSTTCASGKPLRLMKNSSPGISGTSFAISPLLNHGVSKLSFTENTGGITKVVGVYKSLNNGSSWTLVQLVPIGAVGCDTSTVIINDTLVNKLKFTNESASDVNMDWLKVYKYGDSTVILPPPPPIDTLPYYPDDSTKLKAFPGAEGAGKFTTGGRGGVIYEVTNLLDDANGTIVGSFRWAEKHNTGPKTIIFRVSGTIHLAAPLSLTRGNLTIAGQTAPGDGICFADMPMTMGKTNVIIRYIRVRLGDIASARVPLPYASSAADCIGSSGGDNADSMIVDHVSSSWSIDEAMTFKNMKHFTMQNCMITEPLNQSDHSGELHGYGGIWGGNNASFHHNLFAHCSSRCPRFNGSRQYSDGTLDTVDLRNNVIYNWGINTVYGGEGGYYNVVNNYYKPGPSTDADKRTRTLNPYSGSGYGYGKYYMTGNRVTGSAAVTNDNWQGVVMEGGSSADIPGSKLNSQVKTYRVPFTSADSAYQSVLLNAGAILPKRDTLDQRIIRNVIDSTGKIIDVQGGYPAFTDSTQSVNAWPNLQSLPAPSDFDHDGMPSEWEWQRGLDSTNANDRNFISPNGYTNLENYLNGDSIVAQGTLNTCVTAKQVISTNTGRWLDIKDTSYFRIISTDTTNMIAAIKDNGSFGAFNASYYTSNTLRYGFNSRPYLNRNITITPVNPGSIISPVTVRLFFTVAEYNALKDADNSISSLADLRIIKVSNNSCITALPNAGIVIVPTAYGMFGTYSKGYYVEFVTSSFSTFFIASAAAGVLPVELVTFNAAYSGNTVNVNWKSSNESNIKNFNIERSSDGRTFNGIGSVNAINGQSNLYSFNDGSPLPGVSYYRLKINSKDGGYKYSSVVAVKQKRNSLVEIYPNPAINTITVFHERSTGYSQIKMVLPDGKQVMERNILPGIDFTTIDITSLSKGVYILQYKNELITISQKLIKQ